MFTAIFQPARECSGRNTRHSYKARIWATWAGSPVREMTSTVTQALPRVPHPRIVGGEHVFALRKVAAASRPDYREMKVGWTRYESVLLCRGTNILYTLLFGAQMNHILTQGEIVQIR